MRMIWTYYLAPRNPWREARVKRRKRIFGYSSRRRRRTKPPDGQTIELLDEQEECQTKATDVLPEEKTHRDASAGEYIDESEEEVVDPEVNPIDGSNDNEPLLDAERQRCY
jgi:hypothetical protein